MLHYHRANSILLTSVDCGPSVPLLGCALCLGSIIHSSYGQNVFPSKSYVEALTPLK